MDYLVDVNIAVYNHALFLEKTLDSVLEQKTNFPFRLLIGDDFSTDGSIEILKRYEREFPDKIKVIYQPKNLGLNSPERNGIIILRKSTAKYIALLDGDDYWTDAYKLQKQVDFLESNPEFSICFHLVESLNDQGQIIGENNDQVSGPGVYTIVDLAKGNMIYTPSVVFRNMLNGELPDWFSKSFIGDYVLHMLSARHGKIYCIPEVMAVYRIHSAGTWSNGDLIFKTEKWTEMLGYLVEEFKYNSEVHNILLSKYSRHLNWLSELYGDEKQYEMSSNYLIKALQTSEEYASGWARDYYELKTSNQLLRIELQNIKQGFLSRLVRVMKNPGLVTKKIFSKSTKKIRAV